MSQLGFMYDNHGFARPLSVAAPREQIAAYMREHFAEDGCGMGYFKNSCDTAYLHGRRLADGGYGITEPALTAFLDKVDELVNWEARG